MQRPALLGIGLGGGLAIGLIAWAGAGAIGEAVLRAGWMLPPLLALHAVQVALSAVAWRLVSGGGGPGMLACVCIRWIREAVNSLLPVAQIGGLLVGVRLLGHRGLPLASGGAGTTLDLTVEAVSQFLFTLLGLGVLALAGTGLAWRPWLGGGLLLAGLALGAIALVRHAGVRALLARLAARLGAALPSIPLDDMQGMHAELIRLRRQPRALSRAAGLHMLAWLLGIGETWLALAAVGWPVAFATALVIESLGMAARSAGFLVPGALGVQEGGFLLVGSLFGVPAEAAVGLSVLKRARELLAGLPGLAAWQWAEGVRLASR
jgi:putative membrane protein